MTGGERGFLLLSSHLGNPERRPLSVAQLRSLARRVQNAGTPPSDRQLDRQDLMDLGYGAEMAGRIVSLLSEEALLNRYLARGLQLGCIPITRISPGYPLILRKRLGLDSPGVLWVRGDAAMLSEPTVALVGSRELEDENRLFAAQMGFQAALQGYTLVSGNARGADQTAQGACLEAGGQVICLIPDELGRYPLRDKVLYVSEDGYSEPFTSARALSRNRCIHALGLKTFVAQASLGMGGTWDGTVKNLRGGWSPVFCFDDGREATRELIRLGANPIRCADLNSIYDLTDPQENFFDR